MEKMKNKHTDLFINSMDFVVVRTKICLGLDFYKRYFELS
jgi:hypothetical protein